MIKRILIKIRNNFYRSHSPRMIGGFTTNEGVFLPLTRISNSTFIDSKVNLILENNVFIGWIIVRPFNFFNEQSEFIRDDSTIELGWRFKQSAWGQGYASEAASTIMNELAKNPTHLHFCATALAENIGSINIMKKLGMTFVKNYTHSDKFGDRQAVFYQR